ncbi:serine endopeptidase [Chryseobacterium piperi]|uniref:Serine endopeptidase n=1 Tax=Chryseobacterium piperi TaxID=558152 RepID=A0A086BKK3_9FLAO|nr:microviridin/marinostatin family tricyclic proteinase inhibitor [Chryseobacterium piperi]ASW72909.1 serine endopeptidase [Chryseobacterium piperi]KFF29467.1 serine endopeptidase [Chryseobacterium piperi]
MKNKKQKKPFFASFLEKQIQDPEKVTGGGTITTPSIDVVTIPTRDNITSFVTDNITTPGNDHVTLKYPSDSDESGPLE